jgi:hypothetical protein
MKNRVLEHVLTALITAAVLGGFQAWRELERRKAVDDMRQELKAEEAARFAILENYREYIEEQLREEGP